MKKMFNTKSHQRIANHFSAPLHTYQGDCNKKEKKESNSTGENRTFIH
jgi:hypothetical protein